MPAACRGLNMRTWASYHHKPVPGDFRLLTNPFTATEEVLQRGQSVYEAQCASCHGEKGMGDGPAGAQLTPPPAPLACTAKRLPDAYLYWRIAKGGAEFGTAMPAFENVLPPEDIWAVILYLRNLQP